MDINCLKAGFIHNEKYKDIEAAIYKCRKRG